MYRGKGSVKKRDHIIGRLTAIPYFDCFNKYDNIIK